MSEEQVAASESSPKKSSRLKSGLLLLGFAGVLGISAGIFAANITVNTNSGGNIEFGAGVAVISTCVDEVDVSLTTQFNSSTKVFYLASIELVVTDDNPFCADGTTMTVNPMSAAGISLVTTGPTTPITFGGESFSTSVPFTNGDGGNNIDSADIEFVNIETR